jgi:predicted kinase
LADVLAAFKHLVNNLPGMPRIATLFLICGLPGSGKSTLARRIETAHQALRLAPDEWMLSMGFDGYDQGARATVEKIQWELAQRALQLHCNVVLESGFWTRRERDDIRVRAAELGAMVEILYLDVPKDTLVERLHQRNADLPPNSFHVVPDDLDDWMTQFEPPSADEPATRIAPEELD